MKRKSSIEALLKKSHKDAAYLQGAYQSALANKEISGDLKVDIKNVFENLRSCLDYLAHEILEKVVSGKHSGKLYFPIRNTKLEFENAIDADFPKLTTSNPAIYSILEKIQPYNDPWLGKFNKLNNENKHQDLVEQTRKEDRRVTVSHPSGGSVSWGSGVTFGGSVAVMGVPIDHITQMPVPNNLVKTEVVVWVDFNFQVTGDSVLPFINDSISKVEKLFGELAAVI